MERVLIAGCGRIGTELGLKLSEYGYNVWGIRRSGQVPTPLHTIQTDLLKCPKLDQAFDYVIFTTSADNYTRPAYKAAYLDCLKKLTSQLSAAPKKFIYTSSTAVYGQHQGEWVDECSITEPAGFAGEYLLEAERFLSEQSFPSTVVRYSGIYGPEYKGLLEQVKTRKIQLTSHPHYTNRIHSVDCVRVLEFILKQKEADSLYLATDCEPVEKNTLIHWLEDKLNLPKTETISQHLPKRGNKRSSNKKLLNEGFTFQYPTYVEGYETCITASASI